MAFRAELNYTPRDMRQYDKAYKKLRYRILAQAMSVLLTVLLLVVTACFVVLIAMDRLNGALTKYFLIFLASCVVWIELNEFRFRGMSKALNRQGPALLTADEAGLRVVAGSVESSYGYDSFTDMARDRDAYYLYISKASAVMIPDRCFTEGDPASFGAFIEQKTGLKMKRIK